MLRDSFRLCPSYKATSDKGSLVASYYFSKIAQNEAKKEKGPSKKRECLPWKSCPDAGSKKTKNKQKKPTKEQKPEIDKKMYPDSRISVGLPFLLPVQQFHLCQM